MNGFLILVLLLPTVFCRAPYSFNNDLYNDVAIEHAQEIEMLRELTRKHDETLEPFVNPYQSVIKVTEDDVSFYVYNQNVSKVQKVLLEEAQNITSVSTFNLELKTIVVIHGWRNNYNSNMDTVVTNSYLQAENVNVIRVEWDGIANNLYVVSSAAVPTVGKYVGDFLNYISKANNYSLNQISLVGHSLGAHVAGFAGQETNGAVQSITGLDPAGPLYFDWLPNNRLSEDDAQYVQAIHTDAGFLGVAYSVGHADFWPNGGKTQCGCGLDIICSHGRSYKYFAESLNPLGKLFIAKQCDSYDVYQDGQCKNIPPTIMGGTIVNTTIMGNYYLETNSSDPYALGYSDLYYCS